MLREFLQFLISEGALERGAKMPCDWTGVQDLLSEERFIFYQSIFFSKPYSVHFDFGNEDTQLINTYPKDLFLKNLILPEKSSIGTVFICFNYGKLLDDDTINLFSIPETEVLLVPGSEIKRRLAELFPSSNFELTSPGLTLKDVRSDNTGISLLHYSLGLLVKRTTFIELSAKGENCLLSFNGIKRNFPLPFYKTKLRFEAFFYSRNMAGSNRIPLANGGILELFCTKNFLTIIKIPKKRVIKKKHGRRTFYFLSDLSSWKRFEIDREQILAAYGSRLRDPLHYTFCNVDEFIKNQFSPCRIIGVFFSEEQAETKRIREYLKNAMITDYNEVFI